MRYLFRLFITGAFIFAISYYAPSLIFISSFAAALIASVLLGLFNLILRPLLLLILVPFRILTFGLSTLLVNVFMLYLVSFLMSPSFKIIGWWQAIVVALSISIVNSLSKPHS